MSNHYDVSVNVTTYANAGWFSTLSSCNLDAYCPGWQQKYMEVCVAGSDVFLHNYSFLFNMVVLFIVSQFIVNILNRNEKFYIKKGKFKIDFNKHWPGLVRFVTTWNPDPYWKSWDGIHTNDKNIYVLNWLPLIFMGGLIVRVVNIYWTVKFVYHLI